MEIEKLKPEEITSAWVKENLCMDDGSDIIDCHELIAFSLRNWEDLGYENIEDVLTQFHLIIKKEKDIIKQFKESISKLTLEEYKKIWDEIEADYPVSNPETIEQATEENYWNTISLCEDSNNTNMKYVEELISTSFINGIKFAQRWINIESELPEYYQRVLADNGEYMAIVSRVSDGDEDSYPICGTDFNMYPDPVKWRRIELK